MLRPGLARIGHSLRTFRRSLHQVPPLPHNFENGIPEFLSPAAFHMAWTQYQSLMVEKLNLLTAEGEYESKTPKDIAIKYARDPNSAPIFNYASMAHNNNFFFACLSPQETTMPKDLQKDLEQSFGTIETLQREMIVTASSMFGPGFVWLVKARDSGIRTYSVLTTYLAGSPYPGAHYRRQPVDMNTEEDGKAISAAMRLTTGGDPVNTVGSFGPFSKKATAPGGVELNPVLCINTWEHVYLPDYGVGAGGSGGKRSYAEQWWKRIDWSAVAQNAETRLSGNFRT